MLQMLLILAANTPLLSHVITVLIFCCMISVEYLLHMECYSVAKLQHLIMVEYNNSSFVTDCIPILEYNIMLHTQCC